MTRHTAAHVHWAHAPSPRLELVFSGFLEIGNSLLIKKKTDEEAEAKAEDKVEEEEVEEEQ